MTQEQNRRIIQALDETNVLLARAMRYSPEFRDMKLIAGYEKHIVKLTTMLETGSFPVITFKE